MVQLILAREEEAKKCKHVVREFVKKRKSTHDECALAQLHRDPDVDFLVSRPGRKGLDLSQRSQLVVALRRALVNVSSEWLGCSMLEDLSRWSVSRFEVKLGAANISSFRAWHGDMEARLADRGPAAALSIAAHAFRGDATNSSVWQ